MKSVIFFGDSITEGANSTIDFVEYLSRGRSTPGVMNATYNVAVSGTTIGEYSIYPVDGNSLSALYPKTDLKNFDTIFLEYGVNDVSSIMCGFTTLDKVIISFVKAIDGIKQCTDADIKFLALSTDYGIINKYAQLQCDYLSNDYFKGYKFQFPPNIWASNYEKLIRAVSKRVDVIPMIEDVKFFDKNAETISVDNLHPNSKGHYIIAENISKYI